jgi:hypothetical protein
MKILSMILPLRRPVPGSWPLTILILVALALHIYLVSSVVLDGQPIIWPLHNDTIHRTGQGADFYAVYHAGVNMRQGISPYEDRADGITPYFYSFRYLPIVAAVSQRLTVMAPRQAYLLWLLVLEGILALVLFALSRQIANRKVWLLAASLLLTSSPYFLELYMGQFTFASVSLCGLALMLGGGVIFFSLAVLLKPLCLAAVPALVRRRRYWLPAIVATGAVLALSIPHFVRHPQDWSTFYAANFQPQRGLDAGNYGFLRLVDLVVSDLRIVFLLRHWAAFVSVLRVSVLGATALVVLLSKTRQVTVGVCGLLLAHFITYQHVWEHHMSAVVVIGALLLTTQHHHRWFTPLVLISMLALALPTPFALFDIAKDPKVYDPALTWPRYASYMVLLPKVVPTLLLFISSVIMLCRRPGISQEQIGDIHN